MTTTTKRPALGRGLDALLSNRGAAPAAGKGAANAGFGVESGTANAGVGVGTSAVASAVSGAVSDGKPLEIPVDRIDVSPYQPRTAKNEDALEELARSIAATGVIQPVLVRPVQGRFQLIAGERRWRASQLAGKSTVPAVVRHVSDEQAMEMAIVENLQRSDLNAMEQARAFARLSNEFNLTQEEIALRTGKDRASVGNFMRLVKLPLDVQQFIEYGSLSFGHGRALLALETEDQIRRVALMVVQRTLSVRLTEELVQQTLNPTPTERKNPAPVDPNVREACGQLQQILGMKVQIKDRNGRGRVIVDYANLDDFDRLMTLLLK